MTKELKDLINYIDNIYPLTIVSDRYSGVYSGGNYLAFNLDFDEIPEEINDSDLPCSKWWNENKKFIVGKGESITDAVFDLVRQLMK
jgi:hypothetical protein